MPLGAPRRTRTSAGLLLALLLAAAACHTLPHVAAAGGEGESPSPSPSPSPDGGDGGSTGGDGLLAPGLNADGQPLLTPTKKDIAGREVYYELPQNPVGMYVFWHGCAHNAYDHWPQQPGCEECRGLPGEVAHTKVALSMGYAFVAINSLDRSDDMSEETYRCFSYSEDKDSAVEALQSLRSELGLQDAPLYFAGVSSGAAFALKLPNELPEGAVSGITSEVLAVDPLKDEYDWAVWPPVAFISMKRDTPTNERIARNQAALLDAGVPAQTITVVPRVVYWPTFFSDHSSEISPQLSAKITSALVEIGVLGPLGYVTDDPRHGFPGMSWRSELEKRVPELGGNDTASSVNPDASHVSELLNLAWADHEIIGEYAAATLAWFEGGASGDLNKLAKEYIIRQPALLSAERLQPGEKPATAGAPPVTPWISPPLPPTSATATETSTGSPPPAARPAPQLSAAVNAIANGTAARAAPAAVQG